MTLQRLILSWMVCLACMAMVGCGSKTYAYHQVGQHHLRLELSPEWQLSRSDPYAQTYYNSKLGTIQVKSISPAVITPLLYSNWQRFGMDLHSAGAAEAHVESMLDVLKVDSSQPSVAEAIAVLSALQKNLKSSNQELTVALASSQEKFFQLVLGSNPAPASLLLKIAGCGFRLNHEGPLQVQELAPGVPSVKTTNGLYFFWSDALVAITASSEPRHMKQVCEEFSKIIPRLELDCPPPSSADKQIEGPVPPTGKPPAPTRDRELAWLLSIPSWVLWMVVGVPAYLGAVGGYGGDDACRGSAKGAWNAVFWTLCVVVVAAAAMILIWGAEQPAGSGIATPWAVALIGAFLGTIVGITAAAFMGMAAAMAAYQGARRGPHVAGLAAALAAPVGLTILALVLGIVVMGQPLKSP